MVRGYNTNATAQFTQNGLLGGGLAVPGTNFGGNFEVTDEVLFSLLGSKMFITNFEVRIPFTGPKQLAVIPSNIIFLFRFKEPQI